MINWNELVEQAKNKNDEAFSQLYMNTINRSTIFIRQFIKDDDLAQDILQESYVKAFNNLNSLQTPDKFQTWLNRIIKNSCLDYFKKKKPILFSELGTEEDAFEEFDIEDTRVEFRPEESMDKKETARLVQEMLDTLPEAQRIVLTLRYMEGYSVTEVANELGISEGTVKSRSFKAKSSMERQIEALSKKGIKLRGISIVALLSWLYGQNMTTYAKEIVTGAASLGTGVSAAGAHLATHAVTGSNAIGGGIASGIGSGATKMAQAGQPVGNMVQGVAHQGTIQASVHQSYGNIVGNGVQGAGNMGMQGAGNAGMQVAKSAGAKGIGKAATFGFGKMIAVATTTAVVGFGGYQVYQATTATPEKTIEKLEDACNDLDYDEMVECFEPKLETMLSAVETMGSMALGVEVDLSDLIEMAGVGIDYLETSGYGEMPEIDMEVISEVEIGNNHVEVEVQITEGSTQSTTTEYIEMKKFDNEWRILID